MPSSTIPLYGTKFQVDAGPKRDALIDAFKYARDENVDFTVDFTIATMHEDEYYTNELTVKIDALRHVDLDGYIFQVDASIVGSGASLKIAEYDSLHTSGRGAELYE